MPGSGGMLPARSTSPSKSRRIASCDFSIEYKSVAMTPQSAMALK